MYSTRTLDDGVKLYQGVESISTDGTQVYLYIICLRLCNFFELYVVAYVCVCVFMHVRKPRYALPPLINLVEMCMTQQQLTA